MKGVQLNRFVVLVALSAAWAICTEDAVPGTLQVIHSIDFPSVFEYATDITWDGKLIWVSPFQAQYQIEGVPLPESSFGLDPLDGSQRAWIRHVSPIFNRIGFTWDGGAFWVATHSTVFGLPTDVAADRVYRFSANGDLTGTFLDPLSPDAMPSGLAWDGSNLWLSDRKQDKIMKINIVDMSVIASFDAPGPEPRGLTWDGNSLWSVDGSDKSIYRIDSAGNVIDLWTAPVSDPWGLTYDGQHLWIADNDARTILQLAIPEPSTGVLLAMALTLVAPIVLRQERGRESSSRPSSNVARLTSAEAHRKSTADSVQRV